MIPTPLRNADCLFLAEEDQAKAGYAALAVVEAGTLLPLARDFLAAGYHLEDVSGLASADGAVSAYHFAHFDTPGRATVLVISPLDNPVFPSIASVYQGAEWHERETRDFFGFQYEGNPNFIPLLLSDDMMDVHPLQKPEAALAPLRALFSPEGRTRTIVKQAEGFTLLDVPAAAETPAEEPKEAAEKPAAGDPKPEAPKPAAAPAVPEPEAGAGAEPTEEATAAAKKPAKTAQAKSGKKGAGDAS